MPVPGVQLAAITPSTRSVTGNVPVAGLPELSPALQFTVVVPSANVEPDAGMHVTATVPSMSSVAVATNGTGAPALDVASAVIAEGSDSEGGVETYPVVTASWMPLGPLLKPNRYPLPLITEPPNATSPPWAEISALMAEALSVIESVVPVLADE